MEQAPPIEQQQAAIQPSYHIPIATLIVEPDPLVCEALAMHFRTHPHIGIATTANAAGALSALTRSVYDIVVLDGSQEDAAEVATSIHERYPSTVIIGLVPLATPNALEHLPASIVSLVLTKPTPPALLERAILHAASYRSLQEQLCSLKERHQQLTSDALAQLQQEYKHLKRVHQEQQDRFRIAIHDLQNPLANLATLCKELQQRQHELLPMAREAVELGLQSIEMMQTLIEDLLNTTQLDNDPRLSIAPVDVASFVRNTARRFAYRADKKNIWINLLLPSELPVVYADEHQLSKALDNLVSNAIKYTPSGGSVTIQVEPTSDRIRFHVRDTGQGMTPDDIAQAFTPFRRLSAVPTGGEPSTGLGLYIVRRIAELHGGTVTATSEGKGKGSTFTLEIPIAPGLSTSVTVSEQCPS
ncbi:MAG: ATP-binding protein [Chlorobi bacterium]|nr:ATP-binding protein [Chlorobiota bacterium]